MNGINWSPFGNQPYESCNNLFFMQVTYLPRDFLTLNHNPYAMYVFDIQCPHNLDVMHDFEQTAQKSLNLVENQRHGWWGRMNI